VVSSWRRWQRHRQGPFIFIRTFFRDTNLGNKTNVPNIRLQHRHRVLVDELAMIRANNAARDYELHPGVVPSSETVAARAMAKHT
jgi:hypothetical protein